MAVNLGMVNNVLTIGASATTTNLLGTVNATGLVGYAKTGSANTFTETNTFSNATGIKSNSLDATADSSAQTIGSNITTGSIILGSYNTEGGISIRCAANNILDIGGINTRTVNHNYSTGSACVLGGNVNFNNGYNNKSLTNIEAGGGDSGQATGSVNIMTGNNQTGTTTIGQFTNISNKTTTTIKGVTNISTTGGNCTIATGGGDCTIGSSNTVTLLGILNLNTTTTALNTIGSAINNTTINSATTTVSGTLKANTLDATADSSAQTIGSSLTTGSLTLAGGLTSGNITMGASQVAGAISLGLSSFRTGDINIGNNMLAGIIKIGSFFGATSTASVQIGTSGKGTMYLRGAVVNINNDGVCDTNIGTGSLGASNYVSIASSGTNNATSYMNLGSDSLGTNYIRARTVNINGNGAGNTTIGSTTGTGAITLYQPITPAYTYPIGAGKIGQIVNGIFFPIASPPEVFVTALSKTYSNVSLTAGIWSISSYSLIATFTGTVITQAETYFSTGTANYGTNQILNQQNSSTISSICLPINAIIYLTATTTISQYVTVKFSGTAPTVSSFEFRLQAVRIA